MQYRKLGAEGPEVSVVGFGCWETGGAYGEFDESEVARAVGQALDLGVTLFDTARGYGAGASERILGRCLGGRRSEAIVVTKCGLPTREGQKQRRDSRFDSIIADTDASLKDLGLDYVDLMLQHWPDPETPIEESMRALVDIQKAGKARYIGVSNFHPHQLHEARGYAPIITNQVGYNLFDRRWERHMFPTARELGLGVMAYGPMAHGLLTGAFTPSTSFDEKDWRRRGTIFGQQLLTPENLPRNLEVVDSLQAVARELGTALAPLAIAWVLRDPVVSVALSGTRRPEEIEENVKALDVPLTPDVVQRIEGIMEGAAGQTDELPT
jgi:aryl-alcohol dehydrogenase-like predicted oxidoreductase